MAHHGPSQPAAASSKVFTPYVSDTQQMAETRFLEPQSRLARLLLPDTVQRMQERKPDLITAVIPRRGHVPLLDEPESLAAIDAVLEVADAAPACACAHPDAIASTVWRG